MPITLEKIEDVKKRLDEPDDIPDVPKEPLKQPTPVTSPIKDWFKKVPKASINVSSPLEMKLPPLKTMDYDFQEEIEEAELFLF